MPRRHHTSLLQCGLVSATVGFVVFLCLVLWGAQSLTACTIVTLAAGQQVLAGNNEDWTDPQSRMWIVPAKEGEYGRVLFGFAKRFVQGGINEKGLFLDANALDPPGWQPDPSKPVFEDEINEYILAHCATVEDAIAFFDEYSVFLGGGKFVIADAKGESITVEWAEGSDRITRRKGAYQISTNIPQWSIVPGKVEDERYNIAEQVLLQRSDVSVNTLRGVLAATHKEWSYPTIYSFIADLRALKVFVYNFHNFEEAFEFDLSSELAKGNREVDLPSLFKVKTFAAVTHDLNAPKLGITDLQQKLDEGGLEMAVSWFDAVKNEHREIPQYAFFEGLFQQLAADLQSEGKSQEALDVLRFNAHAFADSADAWEQLGDACLALGNKTLASESYEKALTLDPTRSRVEDGLRKARE